jgi:hypothetical protein
MECQYCKKILQNKYSLISHQTKTKYCLKLQGKDNEKGNFICEGCDKDFHQKIVLKTHIKTCESYKPEKLLNRIKILEKEKNINLSVFNKSEKDIKQLVEDNYNKEYLIEGQKGVARFTHSHVLKTKPDEMPMYAITDKTRGNGKYKSSKSEVVIDNGMQGLTKKIHPSIKNKAINIALIEDAMNNREIYQGYQEVFNMNDDNSVFRKEMIRLTEVELEK